MSSRRERLAAMDVGSNTILLTVAEHDGDGGLVVLEEAEDQPRLGAGLAALGRLSEDAIARALRSLTRMRDICRRLAVDRLDAIATAAVRQATNGDAFVRRARALDIPLRIISPETEAALSYRSAAYRFSGIERTLVADIGGGSLELIGAVEGTVSLAESLPLGAVRLTELPGSLSKLRMQIRQTLNPKLQGSDWSDSRFIGSGGTFATLASMALASRGSSSRGVHGTMIQADEVEQLLESLATMSPEQRRQTAGLKPERADIIVAGLAVVAELLKATDVAEVTVSGYGLRDGLLLEMAGMV